MFFSPALKYAERGIPVFPLRPRGKAPLTPNGLKDASTIAAVIEKWWRQWPEANIGLVTGKRAGLWVLDIDGLEGESTLRALEEKYGPLPPTVEVITGGDGRHLYFQYPAQGEVFNSAGRVGPKIDVRGHGGYVVAPPSLHETGRRYSFSVDSYSEFTPTPSWLLALTQKAQYRNTHTDNTAWISLVKGVNEGQRNSSIARLAGKLLRCNLPPIVTLELCLAWNDARCTPPLGYSEVAGTVNSIAGREIVRRGGKV